jgi:hypothetical protein
MRSQADQDNDAVKEPKRDLIHKEFAEGVQDIPIESVRVSKFSITGTRGIRHDHA